MTYFNCGPAFLKAKRFAIILLVLVWCLGLAVGCCIFNSRESLFSSLMLSISFSTVSIVGLFSVIIPFLISAAAVVWEKPVVLYILCLAKSILYTLSVLAIYSAYGSAGWLAWFFILFIDNCTTAVLWSVWCCYFSDLNTSLYKILAICFGVCLIALLFDVSRILQFAESVFNF